LLDLQPVGEELALKWKDGAEQFVPLETLRRACPCASCSGETDIMGNVAKGPETKFTEASFQIKQIQSIGGYAFQIFWNDGHSSGLYSIEFLRKIAGGHLL
jgi:DUF971 family protein|tara:strand:+ start:1719 stop:2021 length:303 start_codon:yes stop_codon:yes gene_type:complete